MVFMLNLEGRGGRVDREKRAFSLFNVDGVVRFGEGGKGNGYKRGRGRGWSEGVGRGGFRLSIALTMNEKKVGLVLEVPFW